MVVQVTALYWFVNFMICTVFLIKLLVETSNFNKVEIF